MGFLLLPLLAPLLLSFIFLTIILLPCIFCILGIFVLLLLLVLLLLGFAVRVFGAWDSAVLGASL